MPAIGMHGALCHILRNRPATVHLTAIGEDGRAVEIHLSAAAVRQLGLDLIHDPPTAERIEELLALGPKALGDGESDGDGESGPSLKAPTLLVSQGPGLSCAHCGLSYREFLEHNRFGCAACYDQFGDRLAKALVDIHGSARHVGRVPASDDAERQRLRAERDSLRRRLADAVADEAFEEAASLRDRLRRLEDEEA